MLAIFGAPISYMDNQENAIRCALEMRTALAEFNRQYPRYRRGLHFGIGINTGEVIVGNVGSEDRVEYTAIGDTVNVGSRIEGLTRLKSDSILISESTYRSVKEFFSMTQWEPMDIKGKNGKITVYEVVGVV